MSTTLVDHDIARIIKSHGNPPVDCPPQLRMHLAHALARATTQRVSGGVAATRATQELSETGIVRFPNSALSPKQAGETRRFLKKRPVYNAHVPAQSDGKPRSLRLRGLFSKTRKHAFGSYKLEDIVRAPHLLEIALSEKAINLAASYLGCVPTLYSMNAWWAFGGRQSNVTRSWHRDPDDYRFVALFIFLTNINEKTAGQHVFVKYSHDEEIMRRRLVEGGMPEEFPFSDHTCVPTSHPFYDKHGLVCAGPAGSVFMADTYGVHRALPTATDRLVFWARYGLHAGRSYVADQTKPVPKSLVNGRVTWDARLNHVARLLFHDG